MKRKGILLFLIFGVLFLSTGKGCSTSIAADSVGFTVNWIDYDDNEDGDKDRIDITLMTTYFDDVFVVVDGFIHVKVWENAREEYSTVDFITHHHESYNTAGNGEGYIHDFRPVEGGQFQITVKIFMNNTLQLTEIINWQGWKSDITETALESTWTEYDKDNDGFSDTISINFLLRPNTTGIIDVQVNTTAFLLDEEATELGNVLASYSNSSLVNSTLRATISVNITLNSPLTGDLILDNKISIQGSYYGFEFGLNTILWENAHEYGGGPKLLVKATNLDLVEETSTISTSEDPFIPGLQPLDGSALVVITLIVSVIAIVLISVFEQRK